MWEIILPDYVFAVSWFRYWPASMISYFAEAVPKGKNPEYSTPAVFKTAGADMIKPILFMPKMRACIIPQFVI